MSVISFTAPRFERRELSSEFNSLTVNEKDLAREDLYGSGTIIQSAESKWRKCILPVLLHQIDIVPEKSAYTLSLQHCPSYVQNDRFYLSFLRAVCFDPEQAASRIIRYWEEKLILFGPEKTFKPLTIHDLEPQDMETIRKGGLLMLPGKDATGRGLLFTDCTKWTKDRDSMMRILWFNMHINRNDDETQEKGLVVLNGNQSDFTLLHFDRKLNNRMYDHWRNVLPFRICGIHFLIKNDLVELVLPQLLYVMGKDLRARVRIHQAGVLLSNALKEHGIPAKEIPQDFGGTFIPDVNAWLEIQILKDTIPEIAPVLPSEESLENHIASTCYLDNGEECFQ